MAITNMNPKVDFYFTKAKTWQEEYILLRSLVLDCGLTEELKWGVPCYTFKNANVVLIHGFKDYCALLFHKGALLKDQKGMLIQQTENVQAARQLRFTSAKEILKLKPSITSYIKEALAIEKAGLKVPLKKTSEFKTPEEFQEQLNKHPGLKTAFKALTPGRQRAYLLYFSSAKQSATRQSRIQKYIPHILNGKGIDD